MSSDFSPITFCQRTSETLLRRYFQQKHSVLHAIDFDQLPKSGNVAKTTFLAFTELPEGKQAEVEAECQEIESMANQAGFLQGSILLLSLSAYLPQWKKVIATRSSKHISLQSWLLWTVSAAIAVFYAVAQYQTTGHGTALVFSSAVNLPCVIITVYLLVMYRKKDPRS